MSSGVERTERHYGPISLGWGEDYDAVVISPEQGPLAEELEHLTGRHVSVRYWTSAVEMTWEAVQEEAIRRVAGKLDSEYEVRYSEITGFLWADARLIVGGHDLLERFEAEAGRWLYLEIDLHEEPA